MSNDAEYEEILREMAIARRELVEDAREVVSNAKELTDWRHYVRKYPWLFAGTAFVVGYSLIPTMRRSMAPPAPSREAEPSHATKPQAKSSGWTSTVVALASSAALRLALGYAGQQIETWLQSQANGKHGSMGNGNVSSQPRNPQHNVDQHAATF